MNLTELGRRRVDFDAKDMPVLEAIRAEWQETKPFEGLKVGVCLHTTTETAVLIEALVEAGADVLSIPSNPLS